MAFIHSSKISLFALFVVSSTNGATIFNALLFILFLTLSTINYHWVRRIWGLTIILDAFIIISMYTVEVQRFDTNLNDVPSLMLIGLTEQKTVLT